MFDSVLNKGSVPQRRLGVGTVVSIVVHVGLIALVIGLSATGTVKKVIAPELKFIAAAPPPPPPPPPPPAGGSSKPKTEKKIEKKVEVKPDVIVQPKEIPVEKPKEAEPQPEPEQPSADPAGVAGGVEGGVAGGVVGGQIGGVIGGTVGGTVGGTLGGTGEEVLPFGEGMTKPSPEPSSIRDFPIEYSREAREAKIEGTMLLKCVVLADGSVRDCKIIKPLPHMAEAVMAAVPKWHFTPVTFQGKPINCSVMIPIKLSMPR